MNRKLKIAIFTFGFYTGGTERQIVELIKGIDRSRFTLYLAAVRPGGHLESKIESAGIHIEYFPIKSLLDSSGIRQLHRLRQFLVRNEIDLLHTYSTIGNTFGVLAGILARIPVIITSRRDMYGSKVQPLYGPLQRVFSHCADAIITNASAIKKMIVEQEHVKPDKISVVHNGLDLSQFVDRSCGAEIRRELGIGECAKVIGVLAELKPVKGHIYLFEAARSLIKILPDLRILIIGDSMEPSVKAGLETAAKELGIQNNVIFMGRSQEAARLLTTLDISVLPSLSEGLSNAILESMAAGVPVVATNVGGNPELVMHGETGLLVPPKDSEALAAALLCLLNDPQYSSRLAANAREMVISRFSNGQMIASMEALYLGLAKSKVEQTGPAVSLGLRRRMAAYSSER